MPFRSVYWSNELAHQHLEKSTFIENQGLEMGRKQIDVNRGHRAAADYDHLYMGRVDQPAAKRRASNAKKTGIEKVVGLPVSLPDLFNRRIENFASFQSDSLLQLNRF